MSCLSLLLCMSMLVGTTFAWFTDSVTSGRNVIQSGNLDVVLEYWDGDSYEDVETTTKLFDDAALWEPGYTEVAYLKVSNAGSLALKYQLSVNVYNETAGVNKAGESFNLSDHLVFKVVESETDLAGTYTRETAKTAAGTALGLNAYNGETKALEETDDAAYLALIIYMPETVGNEANHNGTDIPSIELGVDLFATQYTYEEDSFDDQYDKDAGKTTEVSTVSDLVAALNAGGNIKLTADIDASVAETRNMRFDVPANTSVVMDLNGYTLTSKDGGGKNTMAIYVNRGAELTLNDSQGGGKVVSSCYGVYVQPNAKFTMNGGTLVVTGNGVYDVGVSIWNAEFVMNGGAIEGKFGVWASNYWKENGEPDANICKVTIADGCTVTSTGYADVEIADATDTILNVPDGLTVYSGE